MVSYLATVIVAIGVLSANSQPTEWQDDYGKALSATRSKNQPLLVVLDKPKSAEARIEPALLSQSPNDGKSIESLKDYNLCHVDVSTDYGKKVAKAFKAKKFPHLAIIDRSGSVIIFSKSGKIDRSEWSTVLATHREGRWPAARRVSYKLGDGSGGTVDTESTPVYRNPGYCPSCQRRGR